MMHPRQPTNPSCICTRTRDTTHLECSSCTVQVRFRPNPNHASHLRLVITSLMHDSIRGVARIPTSLRKRISRDPTPKPTPPTTNTPQTQWRYRSALGPNFARAFSTCPHFPPHRARVAGCDGVEQTPLLCFVINRIAWADFSRYSFHNKG